MVTVIIITASNSFMLNKFIFVTMGISDLEVVLEELKDAHQPPPKDAPQPPPRVMGDITKAK